MKKKLDLGQIKVKSFVTNLEGEEVNTVKGGAPKTVERICSWDPQWCTWVPEACDTEHSWDYCGGPY